MESGGLGRQPVAGLSQRQHGRRYEVRSHAAPRQHLSLRDALWLLLECYVGYGPMILPTLLVIKYL